MPDDLAALAAAGADGLDPAKGTPPFIAPTGYDSCHSTVCTSDTEAVARAVLEAAGVPGLLAERQKVRELHAPDVHTYENASLAIKSRHVGCAHCTTMAEDEELPADWPCDTAEIVYTAEEIAAVLRTEGDGAT